MADGLDKDAEKALKERKEREKDELYALDISGVEWHSAPGTEEHEERVEIAYLPEGAVAMRSSLDPDTVLRYTEAEWRAFVLGARDGEASCEQVAAVARRHLAQVQDRIADLQRVADELARTLESCANAGRATCTILQALRQPGDVCMRRAAP